MATLKFTINGNHFNNAGGLGAMIPFAKEADALGYDYLRLGDHVVGYIEELHPEIEKTPYTSRSEFMEVFTLMAYLAAVTERLGFITGVLGLPQRQTALVAKQAAQVDILSNGRLILGIGIGYNSVEFQAMGMNFKDRAPRIEEQIEILRAFWTQPAVTYSGRWHDFADVNVNPPPVHGSIPIYMGAGRQQNPVPPPKVLERIGKFADGFMPLFKINAETGKLEDDALAAVATVRNVMAENGRDPATLQLEIGLYPHGKSDGQVREEIDYLRSIGVTHVHARFPDEPLPAQLDFIRGFAELRDGYRRDHD